jgi:RNA-directed DNA polymerase
LSGNWQALGAEESAAGIVPGHNNREGPNLLTKAATKMRKSEKRRKNPIGRQLELFNRLTGEPELTPAGGTRSGSVPGVELLSLLEKQRALTENILERIVDYGNLNRAYQRVESNDGSCGIDGMDIKGLKEWLGQHLTTLSESLLTETYEVSGVRKVEIPKASGGKRMLGIPTVKDRLVQQAIHQELSRYYDTLFSEHSYGFRPGRSAHQAILKASEYIKEGNEWVVDLDLEKFFDKINHDRLMQRLSKGIGDKRLLRLIRAYLKAGVMEDGLEEQRIAGTPQGGPLSPLLSNIVLDELDKELEKRGHKFCRFADDCNIYVRSKKAGERVMTSIIDFIEKKLKLKVNYSKSGVKYCWDVSFLGYTIQPGGGIRVSDKSLSRLREKIKRITRRNRGVKFETIIDELNTAIIGWTNYFQLVNIWLKNYKELDSWLRRKCRCYRLKQCGRRYTIFKFLRSFGFPENKCWNVIMYSQGWWQMSKKQIVSLAMSPKWFSQLGLHSLFLRFSV